MRGMFLVMRVRARLRRGMKVGVLEGFGNSIDFTIKTPQLAELNRFRLIGIYIVKNLFHVFPGESCIHFQQNLFELFHSK